MKYDIHDSFPQNPAIIFHIIDYRGQGVINYQNLTRYMDSFGLQFGFRQFNSIMKRVNKAKNTCFSKQHYPLGVLNTKEFIDLIMPSESHPNNYVPFTHAREFFKRSKIFSTIEDG